MDKYRNICQNTISQVRVRSILNFKKGYYCFFPIDFPIKLTFCLNINMSKTITIRNLVYDELLEAKKQSESFIELLDRLVKSED